MVTMCDKSLDETVLRSHSWSLNSLELAKGHNKGGSSVLDNGTTTDLICKGLVK